MALTHGAALMPSTHRRHISWRAAALMMAGALAAPAWADTLSWRQTSVVASQSGPVTLRKGVAVFNTKETATMTVQLRALAPPADGKFLYTSLMEYQFAEGSTLALRFDGESRVTPEGSPAAGEMRAKGEVVSGTGRFAGATGSFQMRIRTGLDVQADGILGDNFAAVDLDYSVRR